MLYGIAWCDVIVSPVRLASFVDCMDDMKLIYFEFDSDS